MKKKRAKADAAPTAELLAAALRAQSDGVLVAATGARGRGLKIIFANDSFCAMTGRSVAELEASSLASLYVEKADIARLTAWQAAPGGALLTGESYLLRQDGSTVYAAWNFSRITTARGRVTHLVGTYRDTTEKRQLQEALVHSQRLDAVGRLAGGVAHDFNNLLSVINGYCEMLAAQVSDRPRALREVNEIHRSGLRAAALTRQLLAFGRRQPMDAHVFNLNRLVQENADIMGRLVGSTGRLELDLAPKLGNVRADPTQFQQVLLNLVINARDALRDRGCVTISTNNRQIKPGMNRRATDTPPGRYVSLSVSDNGTGMDAETQKHLFEPFFTTKPEGRGTGLGLALVYGIVQQSLGYISVRSALLAGSSFEILLPEVDETEQDGPESAQIPPLPATRGHETLLLVEDDTVVCKMVVGMLTSDGYRVLAASSPAEAKKILRDNERPVQLLIGSLEKDGEALARSLHQSLPDLRVLQIGPQDSPKPIKWLARARQAGLGKPFALSEILKIVRALLDA
jgi:two-component system cell cycle sensor histidine kinase/response regulator CckA